MLVCLTVLRRMFTETNEEEFSIRELLKHTKLVDALHKVLTVETEDNLSIKQETLWVILNMTYCCSNSKEVDDLVD